MCWKPFAEMIFENSIFFYSLIIFTSKVLIRIAAENIVRDYATSDFFSVTAKPEFIQIGAAKISLHGFGYFITRSTATAILSWEVIMADFGQFVLDYARSGSYDAKLCGIVGNTFVSAFLGSISDGATSACAAAVIGGFVWAIGEFAGYRFWCSIPESKRPLRNNNRSIFYIAYCAITYYKFKMIKDK